MNILRFCIFLLLAILIAFTFLYLMYFHKIFNLVYMSPLYILLFPLFSYLIYIRVIALQLSMKTRNPSKFKADLISTKETRNVIEQNKLDNVLGLYGFISDQTPRKSGIMHWYTFLGVETPIHIGAETLAKQYDMNVVYLKVRKVKRGYYEATLELLSDDVLSVPNYEISEAFIRKVEQQIYEAPEYYLWTHKRWKHKRE